MKITSFLLLIGCLHVSARTGAQYITLSVKDAKLQTVLTELEKQSGYDFFFNDAILKAAVPVTLSVKETPIEQVLSICFKDQPLYFKIIANTVVISDNPATAQDVIDIKNSGPPGEIKGRITTAEGITLSGANIIIQRTKKGTQTNAKGEFALTGVYPADVLKISYIGYKTLTIKVGDGKEFPIIMEATKNELDQVVVQAYGTTTQRLATGNIATVTAAQIERQPVMNVLEALQGQLPGVIVQQTSGYASAPFKVEIRGRNALNPHLPSEPLYIIDGVPLTTLNINHDNPEAGGNYESGSAGYTQNGFNGPAGGQSPFFSINPQDIESLTVLKDADATAIYGSRGANGVIIITTKKGRPGKTKFDLNIYMGANKKTGHYDLLNLQQYLMMRREAFRNDGIVPDAGNAYDLILWDTTRSTDWQKLATGNIGITRDVEASVSGGDRLTSFRVSGSYHNEKGALTYSGADQRGSLQFNLSHRSWNQRFTMSFSNMFSYAQSDLIEYTYGILQTPNAPGIFDAQGHLNYSGWAPLNGNYPYQSILQPYTSKTLFLNSQIQLQLEIAKGLTTSVNLGYNNHHQTQEQIFPITSFDPAYSPTGRSSYGNNNGSSVIIEPQIEYKRQISKGSFSVFVGSTYQIINQDGDVIMGYGYTNDALLHSISNAPNKNASDGQGQYKYAALFARVNYNWEDKYILNLSGRRDGSSRFGPGKQYGNFGAIGAAWIFTEEKWMKDHLPFLSFGKLRGSYGITGSDLVGEYQYLTQWSGQDQASYQSGTPAYVPLILANPDFRWEKNKKLELALAFGFMHDRFNVEFSVYRNRCGNQLVEQGLPIQTGFPSITINSPANVQNQGYEISFRAKLLENKNYSWSVGLNLGRNFNKLLSFPNLSNSNPYYIARFAVGKPLNIQSLLHYTGVDPQTGQYTFEDKIKDGVINSNYVSKDGDTYYKETNILLDGGFTTDFSFRGFQVNAFFSIRRQPYLTSAIYYNPPGQVGNSANQSVKILDRWQKPGDKARFARFTTHPTTSDGNFSSSDGAYSNGSYIRLRNLSISYELPAKLVKKAGLQGIKIYCRGQNLFIITKYDGIDPDVPTIARLPPAKIFVAGVQLSL